MQATAEERAEIDRVFKAYQDSIRREQNAFVKKLNEQAAALNNGIKIKFDDEAGGMTAGFNASYRADSSTIVFSREAVQTEGAANYYLSHELLHNLSAKFMTQEQRSAFYANLRTMMEDVGVNYDSMFRAVAAVYDRAYSRQAAKAADRKNLKGTPRKRYIEAYLYDKFTEETYARFMQTAFGSESILQTLAQQDYTLVEQMRESVQYSSLKALYGSEWDYARLSALDKINRALASPTDAETNREKNAEAIDSGMAELYSLDMTTEKEETGDGQRERTGGRSAVWEDQQARADKGGHRGVTEAGRLGPEETNESDNGRGEFGERSRISRLPTGDWRCDGLSVGAPRAGAPTVLRSISATKGKVIRLLRNNADASPLVQPQIAAANTILAYTSRKSADNGTPMPRGGVQIVVSDRLPVRGVGGKVNYVGGFYDATTGQLYAHYAGGDPPQDIRDFLYARETILHESFHRLADVRVDPQLLNNLWNNAVAAGPYTKDELKALAYRLLPSYKERFDAYPNEIKNEFFAHLVCGRFTDLTHLDIAYEGDQAAQDNVKPKLARLRRLTLEWLQDYADKNGLAVDFLSWEASLSRDAMVAESAEVLKSLTPPVVDWWAKKIGSTLGENQRIIARILPEDIDSGWVDEFYVLVVDGNGELVTPLAEYALELRDSDYRLAELLYKNNGSYSRRNRNFRRQPKNQPSDAQQYIDGLRQMSVEELLDEWHQSRMDDEYYRGDRLQVVPADRFAELMDLRRPDIERNAQAVNGSVYGGAMDYDTFVRETGLGRDVYDKVLELGHLVQAMPSLLDSPELTAAYTRVRELCRELLLDGGVLRSKLLADPDTWHPFIRSLWSQARGYQQLRDAQREGRTLFATEDDLTRIMSSFLTEDELRQQIIDGVDTSDDSDDASYSSDLAAGYSDMTEERLRQYDELRRKYGEYEGGAPKRTNDHTAVSKTAADIIGSEDTPEAFADVLRSRLLDGAFSHIVMTDANAKSSARELLSSFSTLGEAYNAAVNTMFNNQHLVNKNDIAFGEQLIVDMAERIRSIEDGTTMPNESTDPTELFDQLQHLIAQVCSAGTRAGQNLQAFSLLKKMTPTGRLYYINSQIEAFVSEMTDRYGQSRVGGFKFKKGPDGTYIKDINGHYVPLRVDPEIQEELLSCTTKEELDAAEEKALENLASKIPPSLEDRVVAWRYLAMLGNPRTHIRNIVSNYAMGAAVGVKDRIAGAFEDTFLKDKTEGRTKTNRSLSKEERTAMDDFIKQDWEGGVRDQTLTGGKVGFESRLNDKRRKLDGSLDKLAKKNTELLELEDETAALRAYRRAFSNYAAANGLSVDYLASNTMESNVALAQARRYASLEAQKATYRDASTIATLLNQLERKNAVSKIIVGGLVPFKKTPINILSRGVSYSPIGLVKGAVKWRRAATSTNSIVIIDADGKTRTLNRDGYAKEKYGKGYKDLDTKQRAEVDERFLLDHWDGSFSPTDNVDALNLERADDRRTARAKQTLAVANAIDELASGLTGTGILLLGVLLSHLGMLKGAGSDDDTEEYYDQMLGNQEYSVTIGGKNITLDWLTPISMPLFAGAAINEVAEDELEFSEIAESIARIADPVTNLSVLQGINDAMSSYDSDIGKFAASAAGGWVSQFIPTALGQVARSLDETRRTTYAPKDAEGGKQFATFVNKLENKIPGLSQQNAAYVDQWGRHETNSGDSFVERLINNSVVPWYSRDVNRTAADDYLTALRDETGSTDVLPDSPKSYYTFGNETFYLASDEYQTTKELVGQISSMGVNSLMAVPGFSQLSADDQAELVSDVYSFAKNFARADYAAAKGIDYEMPSSTAKIRDAVAAGMPLGTALYVQHVASGITADKDASGKTIRNSRKNKLYSFYTSLGLTRDQINAIAPYEYD